MDELCQQLAAFHINERLRRLAQEQDSAHKHHNDANPPAGAETQISPQEKFTLSSATSISRPLLPNPSPGARPCWEPPLFDYSWFDKFLQAGKEMATREGSQDVTWRSDAMDMLIETELLVIYGDWIGEQKQECAPSEVSFWHELFRNVSKDQGDEFREYHDVMERHGKCIRDMIRLQKGLLDIAREKDVTFERYSIPPGFLAFKMRHDGKAWPQIRG